ncbi:MAG TPA: hypothetical protein VD838_22710, partial [Anaeromyxobacteraceae bacterium]|nr:hypothetical protein [Anaeromyxobacteraceae bacterium]
MPTGHGNGNGNGNGNGTSSHVSGSIGISARSYPALEYVTNATRFPSGDGAGASAAVSTFVTCRIV